MAAVIFESENLRIQYDKQHRQLYIKWTGFLGSEQFRKAAQEVIKAIEHTQVETILSDNTDWKIISPNDHGWAANSWFPQAEAKGVKKLATVLSKDYFNRLSERSIENMADVRCMEIRNFPTLEEAKQWLATSKTPKCV